MAQTIEELRSAAAAISDAVDWLTKVFSSEPQAEDAPASPPEPALTLEQVRAVLADKSRQGHTAEIRALLQKYGASKLSQIDPAHYKALLATMSLTLERRKETALLRGSNLSYNEGVIGLTGHCLSFHARTGKL
ncbi:MAG: hypothetical protein ACLVLG_03035 [Anaerovoracaceae bacterium]